MIYGIGTDIVVVTRLEALYTRHGERLLTKILSVPEREDFARLSEHLRIRARFLAKRFAAKEALGKALGIGIAPPALLPNITVTHDTLGKPAFLYAPALAHWVHERDLHVQLSLSDEADYALAFVVAETA